ncbi:MAG TPA: hypothetical protein VGM18_20530 [Candidatus Sulfotelmatobacter sp.]|jgi:hypothetical protein
MHERLTLGVREKAMWIFLGLASFLLFYKLFISYYLGNAGRGPLDSPPVFARSWFHRVVWSLALLLLGLSALFSYAVSGWLVPVPLILALILPGWKAFRRDAELDATIKKSIVTHYELKGQGVPEPEIFKRVVTIVAGAEAEDYEFLWESADYDWDLERVIQYIILPAKKLHSNHPGQGVHGVEASVEVRNRIRGFVASFERLRVGHEERDSK